MARILSFSFATVLCLAGALAAAPARAENALFTFAEMHALQALPQEVNRRPLEAEEVILYQNMELYVFTVFESLQAANNAALTLHREPLFCAPVAAFQFLEEGDITGLARYVSDELTIITEAVGGSMERYDPRPASEVLLLALRAAFPCPGQPIETASALR